MIKKISILKLKKILIRILLSVLIFLFILFISGLLIVHYNQDKIKNFFIEELNKSLLTEISVKDIDFSVFEKFPNASLSFKEVVAKDASKNILKDTLLYASDIYLEFNIWDLYYKKYKIKNIEIQNSKISLKVDKEGNDNFHFWKISQDRKNSNFSFNLKKIKFRNVELRYLNYAALQYYHFNFYKATASGDFSNDIQNLKLNGNFNINHFQSGDITYLSGAESEINAEIKINSNKKLIEIKKADLLINDLKFSLTGLISFQNKYKFMNLLIKGKQIELHDFINELPSNQRSYFENYKSKGVFDIIINLKGFYGGSNVPFVIANFNFNNGEIFQNQTKVSLKKVNFRGSYSNNASVDIQKHQLKIDHFSCNMENGQINGNFILNDFKNPFINCNASANLNLEELHQFLKNEKINSLKGKLSLRFSFRGKLNKEALNIRDFINSQTSGSAQLSEISFSLKNDNRIYLISKADLQFTNNDVIINTLKGKISESDFDLKGNFSNVIPFIFIDNQKIKVNADLFSENIDLEELIGAKASSNTNSSFHLSDNYEFDLKLHLIKFKFKLFEASSIIGNVKYSNHTIIADNIAMKSMDGNVTANLIIDGTKNDIYKINCDVSAKNADAKKLFVVFDNFGQKGLTSENLSGKITADIQFAADFNSYLQINKKSVWAILDLKIEDGKLNNYQPVMKLSKFINEDDLKNIQFKTLQNQLIIKNELISIPMMEIKSNAINLNISGEHKFNNEISYKINLLLSELASKRRKDKRIKQQQTSQEFGYEEDDGLGHTKLFIKVTGTIDNPVFRYDSKSLKEKLLNDFKKEKENLKNVLKEEFKWLKRDSADIIQEKRFKIQEKGKFVIDWDEENKQSPAKLNIKDTVPQSGVKIKWDED